MCSTYSSFTRSGPQTKTAKVFSRVDDVRDVETRLLRRRGPVDEHGEMVEQGALGFRDVTLDQLEVGAADLDAPVTVRRNPYSSHPRAAASGSGERSAT